MELTVKLGKAENLKAVYPDYEDGWKVNAEPDGTLTDASGREYYGLYYECKNTLRHRDIFAVNLRKQGDKLLRTNVIGQWPQSLAGTTGQ